MSSPSYYWADDDLNSAVLNELAAIEASQVASTSKPVVRKPSDSSNRVPSSLTVADSDDSFDLTFDICAQDLQRLDAAIERDYRRTAGSPHKSPSRGLATRSLSGRQLTLFGDVISPNTSPSKRPPSSSRGIQQRKSPTRPVNRKPKKWDHTAFAKTGRRKAGKDKEKENVDEEGDVEFEQFPAPFIQGLYVHPGLSEQPLNISHSQPPAMKLQSDPLAAKRWLYPLNRPKRDYQFNISRHCLFDNALVALPTGLGKTFIAGVVMLNFYRWFPEGKIVFVAPTKPLVAQQIDACHKTCGIPGRDAIELTGNNPRAFRFKAWQEKRIFYMTPQTFENDLNTDNCDPRDIVLLVIDEAHKGAGEYSYARVVRFLMAKNPYFRVLALTATPGRTPEAVQAIVDALHISRIEIRDEQSLDIRGYVNEKKIEQHIIEMNEGIGKLRDLLANVLGAYLRKCVGPGILRGNLNPVNFHPYRANAAMEEIYKRPDGRQLQWAYPLLRKIGTLARAMGYLLEASPYMCFRTLSEEAESSRSDKSSGLHKDPAFQALMEELMLQKSRGFAVHPKLEKLKTLVVHHFGQRLRDDDGTNAGERSEEDTRAMVFVTFREAVDEIVDFLNQESPLLRVTKFIGQGIDKKGNKGLAQREQLDIINQFKGGVFNVLVATSVGEEGLDIGEVDLIVCYDAQKTPIRMLQRVGRTGRKREGYVHVLLAEGREETNWNKAREAYNDVQRSIVRGEQLELYDDVERLLPNHIKPECLEMVMEIEEYDRAAMEKSRENTAQEPSRKRKRNNDPTRDIPPGACSSFVSVAELLVKQKGKKRKKVTKFDNNAGLDDDTDEEIEAGLFAPKRAASTSATSAKPSKTKLRRTKTTVDGRKKKTKKTKAGAGRTELTLSQLSRQGAEDTDDMEIENGIWGTSHLRPNPSPDPDPPSSPDIPCAQNQSIIDISTSPSKSLSPSNKHRYSTPPRPSEEALAPRHPSPSAPKSPSVCSSEANVVPEPHFEDIPPNKGTPDQENIPNTEERELAIEGDSLAWLLADSDDASAGSPARSHAQMLRSQASDAIEVEDSEPENGSPIDLTTSPVRTSRALPMLSSRDMPPPVAIPPHLPLFLPSSPVSPAPSLPIRTAGRAIKRSAIARLADFSSSPLQPPPPSQKRLRRYSPHDDDGDEDENNERSPSPSPPLAAATAATFPSPTKKKRKRARSKFKVRDTAAAARLNPWIDVEAGHSGDEVSSGLSDEESENESDRRFVTDLPPTQRSPSSSSPYVYDQAAVYRQSLLSQAPVLNNKKQHSRPLPVFAAPPRRHGVRMRLGSSLGTGTSAAVATTTTAVSTVAAGAAAPQALDPSLPRRGRAARFSSPAPPDDEEDYYMLGSFVVDDEAEISFVQSSSEP